MMRALVLLSIASLALGGDAYADQRPTISPTTKIVGSSTVSPFAALAHKALGATANNVQIDTVGTRAGVALFCASNDAHFAPIVLASRGMTATERAACAAAGVGEITELKLGLSGLVIATGRRRRSPTLTTREVFHALAARTPTDDDGCTLVKNPHRRWRDISSRLPAKDILVFGPPLTSGTRDSLIDLAIARGARTDPCMAALEDADASAFKAAVRDIRRDAHWVDAGESDAIILAAVKKIPHAFGVVPYATYRNREAELSAAAIDGVAPSRATIESGAYPLARTLRIYVKADALAANPDAARFVEEVSSAAALGPRGYLVEAGLIPLAPRR